MLDTAFLSPIVSTLVTLTLLPWLLAKRNRSAIDVPNERSLHLRPVPRSGGIAMMSGILSGFAILQTPLIIVLPAAALVVVSHFDDLYDLPIVARLGTHVVAATGFTYGALGSMAWPPLVLVAIAVLWTTNLYNFMDGSDGLAGGMTIAGFACLGVGAWVGNDEALAIECAVVAGAAAAFLLFNFPPARIFMGDAGSIPIGFLAAALSVCGWRDGDWPFWFPIAAFAPFLADATTTLLKRTFMRERFWEPHKKHYYQRLVQMGWSHRGTALAGYALMLGSGAAALGALRQPPYLQSAILLSLVALHAALAFWIDSAWRRRREK